MSPAPDADPDAAPDADPDADPGADPGGTIVRGTDWALPLALLHTASFPLGEQWGEDAMRDLLAIPGCFAVLDSGRQPDTSGAQDSGSQGAGAHGLAMVLVASDEAQLLTLAVLPAARRRGVGDRLLAQAAAEAARLGALSLLLEVSTENAGARHLYEQQGFVPVGRRRGYYPDGSDALVMRRPLPGAV